MVWQGERIEPRLITFDFGDTLVSSEPSYLSRTAQHLCELGYEYTEDEVKRAYFRADITSAEVLLPQAPFTDEEFREVFGSSFFKFLGLEREAPIVGPKLLRKLVEFRPRRVTVPGALEVLERLHDLGYPLGVVSNNDGFTRDKCEAVGIAKYFLFILDSTLEGMMKPDPRIFAKACHTAGVTPETVLHVGDLWGCDIMGARSAGMPAVWLGNDLISPAPLTGAVRIDKLLGLLDLVQT
jgi:HAD superfamily hydrolase (TIGR01549 family)